jgi:hypothetical protein
MEERIKLLAIITICLSFLMCAGCGKKGAEPDFADRILGAWEWIESFGGFAGEHRTPESVGYTKTYVFRPDSTFLEFRNDSLIFRAKYSISEKVVWDQDTAEVLEIEGFLIEQIIEFAGYDMLRLTEHCNDCFLEVFIRIKAY